MNDLDLIKKIVEQNSKVDIGYTDEELHKLNTINEILKEINTDNSKLSLISDELLNFLKEKNIINEIDVRNIKPYIVFVKYKKILPKESLENLQKIMNKITSKIKEINKKLDNKEVKILQEKINNDFKNINDGDLTLLFKMIKESDLPLEKKRDLFIFVSLKSVKYEDEYEEDYKEIDETKKGLEEEACIELFKKYNYDFLCLDEEHREIIKEKGNYEQIDKIFKVLQDNGIDLNNCNNVNIFKIKPENIVRILIKSNSNCVERIIEFCRQHDIKKDGEIDFYTMIKSPSRFVLRKREYKSRKNGGKGGNSSREDGGAHQDFIANVEYFDGICKRLYDGKVDFLKTFFFKNKDGCLLDFPHSRILEIVKVLKTYGLEEKDYFNAATSVFVSKHQEDILDLAIELDMLDYFKENQSKLSMSVNNNSLDYIYLASRSTSMYLKPRGSSEFDGGKKKKLVLRANEIAEELKHTKIPRGIKEIPFNEEALKTFEERLQNEPFDISVALNIIKKDEVTPLKVLEENFKKDDLVYEICGIRISRIKVLRIYSALSELELDPYKGEYSLLTYALTRNSYITGEDVYKLIGEYKKAREKYEGMTI